MTIPNRTLKAGRSFSALAFLLLPLFAIAEQSLPFQQLSPWGGLGEVRLAADATDSELMSAALLDERDRLQWVADQGGFPVVETAGSLDLGVVDPAVELLRVRLTLSNDLPEALNWTAGSLEAQTYDFDVMQAVQRFQLRHGLEATGFVDPHTQELLNAPVDVWISQIESQLCLLGQTPGVAATGMGVQVRVSGGVVIFPEHSGRPAIHTSTCSPVQENPTMTPPVALQTIASADGRKDSR